jgi:hypothetical protein
VASVTEYVPSAAVVADPLPPLHLASTVAPAMAAPEAAVPVTFSAATARNHREREQRRKLLQILTHTHPLNDSADGTPAASSNCALPVKHGRIPTCRRVR